MTRSAPSIAAAPADHGAGESVTAIGESESLSSPHRFYGRPVTMELRAELTDEALKILVPRLSPSMSRLDPVWGSPESPDTLTMRLSRS